MSRWVEMPRSNKTPATNRLNSSKKDSTVMEEGTNEIDFEAWKVLGAKAKQTVDCVLRREEKSRISTLTL